METITWNELLSKQVKFWRIEKCIFELRSSKRPFIYRLRELCVALDDERKFRITRTPFQSFAQDEYTKMELNDLKQIVAHWCHEGPSCVIGFQKIELREGVFA